MHDAPRPTPHELVIQLFSVKFFTAPIGKFQVVPRVLLICLRYQPLKRDDLRNYDCRRVDGRI